MSLTLLFPFHRNLVNFCCGDEIRLSSCRQARAKRVFHATKVYQSLMKVDAEKVRAFSVVEGDGWEIKRQNMETKEERIAKLKAVQAKFKRVEEMLLALDDIDLEADDAVKKYSDGLLKAAELQEEARKEAVALLRLN